MAEKYQQVDEILLELPEGTNIDRFAEGDILIDGKHLPVQLLEVILKAGSPGILRLTISLHHVTIKST